MVEKPRGPYRTGGCGCLRGLKSSLVSSPLPLPETTERELPPVNSFLHMTQVLRSIYETGLDLDFPTPHDPGPNVHVSSRCRQKPVSSR